MIFNELKSQFQKIANSFVDKNDRVFNDAVKLWNNLCTSKISVIIYSVRKWHRLKWNVLVSAFWLNILHEEKFPMAATSCLSWLEHWNAWRTFFMIAVPGHGRWHCKALTVTDSVFFNNLHYILNRKKYTELGFPIEDAWQ